MHRVCRRSITGLRPAEHGLDAQVAEKCLGMGDALAFGQQGTRRLWLIPIHLSDVEHGEGAGENAPVVRGVVIVLIILSAGRRLLPQDDRRTALALVDLGADGLPLPVGSPKAMDVATGLGSDRCLTPTMAPSFPRLKMPCGRSANASS